MVNKNLLDEIISSFARFYWLKPADVVWDSVNAYYIRDMLQVEKDDVVLDLGAGDGVNTSLMFGGKIHPNYDRFISAKVKQQEIGNNQFGDIYDEPILGRLEKAPNLKIDYALELKNHHIKVAKSLNIYKKIIQSDFENVSVNKGSIDKIFSVFAFYWGENMQKQLSEVHRVLNKNGKFALNVPSEHLKSMHIAKQISSMKGIGTTFREFAKNLDGGRSEFVSRHSRSQDEWTSLFVENGFKVIQVKKIVNETMFFIQDSAQRVFFPILLNLIQENREIFTHRDFVVDNLVKPFVYSILDYELKINGDDRHGYYTFLLEKKN